MQTSDEPRPVIRAEPTLDGLYVGWSTYMLGPVFVRPVNAGDATPNIRHQVSCANLEETELKLSQWVAWEGSLDSLRQSAARRLGSFTPSD